MRTIKWLLIVIVSFSTGYVASAQQIDSTNYTSYAKAERDTLVARLQLTELQALRVDTVMQCYFRKLADLSAQDSSLTGKSDSLTRNEGILNDGLKVIFSTQQYDQYQQLIAERRQLMLQRIEEDRIRNKPATEQP